MARVGTTLAGKWRLDALLGVGGTAAVYAATHRNGLRGAVKVLDRAFANDARMRRRFLLEGTLANRVDHAGCVRVLDDDVAEDGCAFLVMELLHGEPLDERAANAGGRLGMQEVLWLAWHLLDVLAAAHAVGIVHRDVKPENVFLTRLGAVKVLDFGLADFAEETEAERGPSTAGSPMGTPAFMSPEQALGRWPLVDAQSDLWSVGATMFALLAGRYVHGDEATVRDMMYASFARPAPSLAAYLPSAPPSLVALVAGALEREKGRRFLDARSMQEAIVAVHEEVFGAPLPSMHAHTQGLPPARLPSTDGLFSFTSSRARSSLPPGEASPSVPSLSSLPALPPLPSFPFPVPTPSPLPPPLPPPPSFASIPPPRVPRSAVITVSTRPPPPPPRRTARRILAAVAAAACTAMVCFAGLAVAGRWRPHGAGPASTGVAIIAAPPAPRAPEPPPAVSAAVAANEPAAPSVAAGASETANAATPATTESALAIATPPTKPPTAGRPVRHAPPAVGPKRTPRSASPLVTVFPGDDKPATPRTRTGAGAIDRKR